MRGLFEEILFTFVKNKKLVIYLNSLVLVASVIILLMLPKWYVGQATMIVTKSGANSGISPLDNLLPLGLLSGYRPDVNRYFVLAQSRRVMDSLIVKFDLNEMYEEPKFREDLYKAIREDIILNENPDGSITIECLYKDSPEKAAEMTNYLFSEIKRLSLDIDQAQAGEYRRFIESVYSTNLSELTSLEDSLNAFQKKYGLFNVEEQGKQIIEMLAELQVEKIRLNTERKYLKKFQTTRSARVNEINARLQVVNSEINRFKNSSDFTGVSFTEFPDAALEYFRIYRDLRVKEKILEIIVPLLEQAKLEEKKNTTEIYLLDKAVPQLKKVKPKRARILVVIMLTSILLTYVLLKSRVWIEKLRIKYNEINR